MVPAGTLPEAVEPFRGPDPEEVVCPHIQLSDSSIHVADGPQDVGTLVAGIVKQSEVERTSDLTLVCPDADLEASLQSILPELESRPVRMQVCNWMVRWSSLHATLALLGGGWSEVEDALRIPGFASGCSS